MGEVFEEGEEVEDKRFMWASTDKVVAELKLFCSSLFEGFANEFGEFPDELLGGDKLEPKDC